MLTYKEFESDIRECFKDVMKKYALKLIPDKKQEGWFLLRRKRFVISFSFDRGALSCKIRISKNNFLDITEFIKDNGIKYPEEIDPWNPSQLLPFYAKIFIDYDMEFELYKYK